ncbi:hypothetical protein J6590_007825 [Homalodisca vitripennis]|nr:hypothetical protein J6590_007825 [Homalodisca vitripennis]
MLFGIHKLLRELERNEPPAVSIARSTKSVIYSHIRWYLDTTHLDCVRALPSASLCAPTHWTGERDRRNLCPVYDGTPANTEPEEQPRVQIMVECFTLYQSYLVTSSHGVGSMFSRPKRTCYRSPLPS